MGKPEKRVSHESPSHKRGDNIKVDLKGMYSEVMGCINLAEGRENLRTIVNMVMIFTILSDMGDFLTS